ncbi:unnamed protein product [Brachionus calyciflorus]|uniref:RNA-directed DNA polymerase from mobile element jockey-like n=1 Tax=Brachionus calyciflorus TaxID=104777 RepID=A0A813U230_9BILA|nr:unnamed protein product [Brachionus calyciflorus]
MAPHKFSYIIFSNGTKNYQNSLRLKLYNQLIPYNPAPTFLGITFDPHFTFKNQIDSVKSQFFNPLNCIKILSNKKWKINLNTLKCVYLALIRSKIDYSSPIISVISENKIRKLESIQNCALRAIFRQPFNQSTNELYNIAKITSIQTRLSQLNFKFLDKAILFENPLIECLIDEYTGINESRLQKMKTLLCEYFSK